MKTTGFRSVVLYILTGAFIIGLGFFVVNLLLSGGKWALNPLNGHYGENGALANAGKILDRNDVILAQSKDGKRLYNDNEQVREAVLHVVGDTAGYISTGVQSEYRAQLSGYNAVTGIANAAGVSLGSDVKLTIDSEVSRVALDKLGDRKGAVALYNYVTGEVLCLVSTPTFDPENVPDIGNDKSGQYDGVYLNRALSSTFAPGSIFKIITSAAAVENIPDIDSRTFTCNGSIEVEGKKITCLEHHGKINFKDAMAQSCNVAFAEIAMELGPDKLTAQAAKMGFNSTFSLDGIPAGKSTFNVSGAGKWELGWSGIGQYTDLANPFHMMELMGAIANGGVPIQPYLVEKISSPVLVPSQIGYGKAGDRLIKTSTADKLKQMMRYDVTSNYGDKRFPGFTVCAKTGTAEVGNGKEPNGWVVGFSEDADCPLAFAVVVENAGYGISTAAPIANAVLQAARADMKK